MSGNGTSVRLGILERGAIVHDAALKGDPRR
jgi:hypothetical protein